MSVRSVFYMSSKLVAALALVGFMAVGAQAGEPVAVEGTAWATSGIMKAKFDGQKEDVAVDVLIEFGPREGLASDEFRMVVDDGFSPVELAGTYDNSKPGKPVLEIPDDEVVDALDIDLEEPGISVELKTKAKAKAKVKDGVDVLKLKFKMKVKVKVDFEGVSESAKIKVMYKGEGTHAIE